MFEPVNGYQVRRELVSWGAEDWATIKPGSIYSGLATLAKQGHLTRHDLMDDGRDVAVYTTTSSGQALIQELIADALTQVSVHPTVGLSCAFAVGGLMKRERFAELVQVRRDNLAALLDGAPRLDVDNDPCAPPLSLQPYALWQDFASLEIRFLDSVMERIGVGDFHFGDEAPWCPQEPSPESVAMHNDRARYQTLIDNQD